MTLFSTILLVAASLAVARAWGPVAHGVMTCKALGGGSLSSCLAPSGPSDQYYDVWAATDLPDAAAFGHFNESADASYLCGNLSYLHSPAFGAFMLSQAPPVSSFNAVSFSVGFLGHTLGDVVGFWGARNAASSKGVLCANNVGPCSGSIRYISLWHYMTAIDAHLTFQNKINATALPQVASLPPQSLAWLAAMSQLYNQNVDPTFAPTTAAAVQACVDFWRVDQETSYRLSMLKTSSAVQRQALSEEIGFFTGFSAAKFQSVLDKQVSCGSHVISAAIADVNAGVSPLQVFKNAVANTAQMYNAGACN